MRIMGIYMGSILALLVGCGVFLVRDRMVYYKEALSDVALCEARGGEWVNGADVPLCMTQTDGLLELVDGSFVAFTHADPWEETYTSPLAGGALVKEQADAPTDCAEHTPTLYAGKIAAVDFSSWPEAAHYRTAITKDVARGANFAGSYVVSTWGCGRRAGDACVGHAIVNAKTGEILLYGEIATRAADFSLSSNRISFPQKNGEEKVWNIANEKLVPCDESEE